MYFKITNENEKHRGLQYQDGIVEDILPFNNSQESCCPGGIYFSDKDNILNFIDYGQWIRQVEIPEDAKWMRDPEGDKFRASKLFFHPRKELLNIDTLKWLIENGVNIQGDDNAILRRVVGNGNLEILKFLFENGVDIRKRNALIFAARRDFLNIVKFITENTEVVQEHKDIALSEAASFGYLEIVKYLLENGAEINAHMNNAFKMAVLYGRLDVVKFLVENGADISYKDSYIMDYGGKSEDGMFKYLESLNK